MRTIGEDKAERGGSLSYIYPSVIRKGGFFHPPYALYVESGLKKKKRIVLPNKLRHRARLLPTLRYFSQKDTINMTELLLLHARSYARDICVYLDILNRLGNCKISNIFSSHKSCVIQRLFPPPTPFGFRTLIHLSYYPLTYYLLTFIKLMIYGNVHIHTFNSNKLLLKEFTG